MALWVSDVSSFSFKPNSSITLYSPWIVALKNGGSSELTVTFTPWSNNVLTGWLS